MPVATTPVELTDTGRRCCMPADPLRMPYGASLSFEHGSHLRLPSDLPSRAEARSQTDATSLPGRCSGLGPCLLGDGFPLSGPQARTCLEFLDSPPIRLPMPDTHAEPPSASSARARRQEQTRRAVPRRPHRGDDNRTCFGSAKLIATARMANAVRHHSPERSSLSG
jgi:hypothetical protein